MLFSADEEMPLHTSCKGGRGLWVVYVCDEYSFDVGGCWAMLIPGMARVSGWSASLPVRATW